MPQAPGAPRGKRRKRRRRKADRSRTCAPGSRRCARPARCRRSAAPSASGRSAGSSTSTCARWATAPSCSTTFPGYPRGHRILANILTSVRRINLTLGMPIDGSAIELVSYWRKYMKEARSIAPVTVTSGPLLENVASGKDVDIQKIPDAALARARRRLLHRHRLHGDHEGSRHRLDQLRRLSRAVPWPERRDGHVLQGQARRPDQAPLSRARRAVPDRGRRRHAPRAVHGGGVSKSPTARTSTTSPAA